MKKSIVAAVLALIPAVPAHTMPYENEPQQHAHQSLFAKPAKPQTIVAIDIGQLAPSHRIAMTTLQGLLARSDSPEQIFFTDSGTASPRYLQEMQTREGITVETALSVVQLVNRFSSHLDKYILYDASNPESLNVATALAAIEGAIAVEDGIESFYTSRGLTLAADVSTRDEEWLWQNHSTQFSKDIVVEQRPSLDDFLRDFAVLNQTFVFYGASASDRQTVMQTLNPDSAVVGWGEPPEENFISPSSLEGAYMIPADFARNLSVYSSITKDTLQQKPRTTVTAEHGNHYVCFVFSDGDNVQWLLNNFLADWFSSPDRERIPLGWGISPSLIDLAPTVMETLYADAIGGENADAFVAGPSGSGYLYPSEYPPAELALHTAHLGEQMRRSDLGIVQTLDFDSFSNTALWDLYTAEEAIDGLIYLEFARYDGGNGQMLFSNNKPVIAARHMLWGGLSGADPDSIVAALNAAPRDPSSPDGYSIVSVHAWTNKVEDVAGVVDQLDSAVKVVTPDQLFEMVRQNLAPNPDQLSFPFDQGLEGWAPDSAGGEFDQAIWTSAAGNPPGAVVLDGSDLGAVNDMPNSSISRDIRLPSSNSLTLQFDTRAQADEDGRLRVRAQTPSGPVVLLDWETLSGDVWVTRSADLTPYAGETIQLIFEQDDSGEGAGEHRYVDNIVISLNRSTSWLLK